MKKLLAIMLILTFCLSLSACKNKDENSSDTKTTPAQTECTEHDIRLLMETNLDCYYLFYVAPLGEGGGTDSDCYTKAETSFFTSYSELSDFVTKAYTNEKSDFLLNKYPSKDNPLYIDKNGSIYVDLDAVKPVEYNVLWDDSYTVTFTENSPQKCSFTLTTTDFDGNEYITSGSAVFENGKWLLTDMVY